MKYSAENLIIHPFTSADPQVILELDPAMAGWEYLHFRSMRLSKGQKWTFSAHGAEIALVVLSGTLDVISNHGNFLALGKRASVFEGLPEAVYLPVNSQVEVAALLDSEFAVAWASAEQYFAARRVSQEDIVTEIRGGDNVTRQINRIIPPGFGCQRLIVVEVYTPSGNWSSYPPHKHDVHRVNAQGELLEADLEEVYYYKINRPEGYAYQRVYTDEHSPLHQAGYPIDALLLVRDNDLVLVPEGYHPVVSPPGYITYYLNVLAGSAQQLTSFDDPRYQWVMDTYRSKDWRVPIYSVNPQRMV